MLLLVVKCDEINKLGVENSRPIAVAYNNIIHPIGS